MASFSKAPVRLVWALLVLVLAGVGYYVGTASAGLVAEVKPSEALDSVSVQVSNASSHAILSISVSVNDRPVTVIPRLEPRQTVDVPVPFETGVFNAMLSAPFHKPFRERFVLEKPKAFDVTVTIPKAVLLNQEFKANVTVCNNSNDSLISIREEHDPSFFALPFQSQSINVNPKECQTAEFSFQPKFSGTTTVFFNVKSAQYSETKAVQFNVQT